MSAPPLIIPGKPVAKGRPKVTTARGYAQAYTPKKTLNYESLVSHCALQWKLDHDQLTREGPVSLTIRAFWPCRNPRKRAPRPAERKVTKPDLDNLVKSVMDGLEGVAYLHDAQVVSIKAEKWYAAQGDAPRVEIHIHGEEEDPQQEARARRRSH